MNQDELPAATSNPIAKTIESVANRSMLHMAIDEMADSDDAVLIVGRRRVLDGQEVSAVILRYTGHSFDAVGLLEVGRQRLFRFYESED